MRVACTANACTIDKDYLQDTNSYVVDESRLGHVMLAISIANVWLRGNATVDKFAHSNPSSCLVSPDRPLSDPDIQ